MKTITILLDTIEKVKSFVNIISQYECDTDLISGRYVIDAKSIMGIFSLNLSKTIVLQIHDDLMAEEIMDNIKEFVPAE